MSTKTSITIETETGVDTSEKDLKILVLIIASDQDQLYRNLQVMWKTYMHYDPKHVEAYFIKGDENLSVPWIITDDVIWSKTQETWRPGILNKTILSMEAMLPRIREFDYIIRTNLSSFYVFPRLLQFLSSCPRSNFYGGSDAAPSIGSGCGFILSPDLVELLVQNKQKFMNDSSHNDDMLIGIFLRDRGIKLHYHHRVAFPTPALWENYLNNFHDNFFHFRLKGPDHEYEIYLYAKLINMFYATTSSASTKNVLLFNAINESVMQAKKQLDPIIM